jgi:DNA mismatch repair ATPase MutS
LFAFSGWISKKATPSYDLLNKISPEAESLAMAIGHIESTNWRSGWLQEKQAMLGNNGAGSQRQIRLLSKILNRFDYRYNPLVFIPLNMLLLWDLQQMLGLQDWKKRNANSIPQWLNVLGNMEAISSLANLHYNEPSWAMPAFTAVPGVFDSRQLGHPLIPSAKRVCSSFTTEDKGRINVITGSNMAGKSTFLRSVGLAIVLANAGGPVCADSLTLSHCRLMSSMRIADNLEENTSTFYAELKKLKSIIAAVNAHEPVFLLLDEILRGTNSHDRQTGSKALVLQMLKQDAVGIIATHDLSLAELSNAHPEGIRNYHFDVQVDGEELYFDYQLKTGVCTSLNASLLMKKIGIEI